MALQNSIRILIVDDNESVRRGIARILSSEPAWQICGEAIDGDDAIQKARQLRPDLVLLDISMPGIGGLETTRQLRQETPGLTILILSQHDPVHLLPRARAAGANGCLDKSTLSAALLGAIRSLADRRDSESGPIKGP